MEEGVATERFRKQNSSEANHGKATIHPLGIAAPAEGWNIRGGGRRGRHRRICRGLVG